MKRLHPCNIPDDGFDFVFSDRQVAPEVPKLHERNFSNFYLMVWLSYTSVNIPYVRRKYETGRSRWTMSKKIKLLTYSLLFFSFLPIRPISVTGLGVAALVRSPYIIGLRLFGSSEPTGWPALIVVLLFVSAFQVVALGVVGEYVWRCLDAAGGARSTS